MSCGKKEAPVDILAEGLPRELPENLPENPPLSPLSTSSPFSLSSLLAHASPEAVRLFALCGFSLDEHARSPWLLSLLESYVYLDASLRQELAGHTRTPACHAGCDACCRQPIPATHAEIMGILRYIGRHYANGESFAGASDYCPFLQDGGCRVYPVRPLACRRFLVFGSPCAPKDPVTETRPDDIFWPSRQALIKALRMGLSYYEESEKRLFQDYSCISIDFFTERTLLLHQVDWRNSSMK